MNSKDSRSVTKHSELRTPANAREELFDRTGDSISAWAVRHGLTPQTVFDLLHGRCKGKRGDSHRAAVLLGLKHGEITSVESTAVGLRK